MPTGHCIDFLRQTDIVSIPSLSPCQCQLCKKKKIGSQGNTAAWSHQFLQLIPSLSLVGNSYSSWDAKSYRVKQDGLFCLFFVLQLIVGDSSNSFSAAGILLFWFLLNKILLDDHSCFCSCCSTTQHCIAVSLHSLAKDAFLFWNNFLWANWVKIMTSTDQLIALPFCKLFKHSNHQTEAS